MDYLACNPPNIYIELKPCPYFIAHLKQIWMLNDIVYFTSKHNFYNFLL